MLRMKSMLLASAAVVALTGASFAADLIIDEPIYSPGVVDVGGSWDGFYVGVHAGYGWGEADWETDAFGPPLSQSYEGAGWLAGVQAGYNVSFDNFVLGVEGDIAWADINGTDFVDEVDGIDVEGSVDWLGTLRARAGFGADAFLLYATAGVAFAGTNTSITNDGGLEDYGSDSSTHTGWVAGLGVEAMVTDNMSVKAEYLYHDFGTETYSFDGDDGPAFDTEAAFNVSTFKVGLNWQF